jgi:hypothetical protein
MDLMPISRVLELVFVTMDSLKIAYWNRDVRFITIRTFQILM